MKKRAIAWFLTVVMVGINLVESTGLAMAAQPVRSDPSIPIENYYIYDEDEGFYEDDSSKESNWNHSPGNWGSEETWTVAEFEPLEDSIKYQSIASASDADQLVFPKELKAYSQRGARITVEGVVWIADRQLEDVAEGVVTYTAKLARKATGSNASGSNWYMTGDRVEMPEIYVAVGMMPMTLELKASKTIDVSSSEDFASALETIRNSEAEEFDICFTENDIDVNGFAGIEGKHITLKSTGGAQFEIQGMGTSLEGDITLDNVVCYGSSSNIFANGWLFETTENFHAILDYQNKPQAIDSLYGGSSTADVDGDTNLIIRGGIFENVYGGGLDHTVTGDTHIILDGEDANAGSLFGGGQARDTSDGIVKGSTYVEVRTGKNRMLFGGGQNLYSKGAEEREAARVYGDTHVTVGYEGAPQGSASVGIAMYSFGGSWHSTVENVYFSLLEGTTTTDRNFYGCGYRDTVKGTVTMLIKDADIPGGRIYGGGDEDTTMDPSYGTTKILNESGKDFALHIMYDCSNEPQSSNKEHGINAGGNDSFVTEINGNVLIDVQNGDLDFAILDNEDAGTCTIRGDAILKVANGRVAQLQGNKQIHDGVLYKNQLQYENAGTLENPLQSGYLYQFHEVLLNEKAFVTIDSDLFPQFGKAQKPFFSVRNLKIEDGCKLTTRDSSTEIMKDAIINGGTWRAKGYVYIYETMSSQNGHIFFDNYFAIGYNHRNNEESIVLFKCFDSLNDEFVALESGYVGKFYGNTVFKNSDVTFLCPVNVSGNLDAGNSIFRLPAVTDNNYDGTDEGDRIPLNIDGTATGTGIVLVVNPMDYKELQTPELGENYITGFKNEGLSDECFLLGNEDALIQNRFLKRVEDFYDGYYMWQVATGITVIFDKNGGDIEAEPKISSQDYVASTTEYFFDIPMVEPTRSGYSFEGWNTKADGSGVAFTKKTPVTTSIRVYAQWKSAAKYTVTYHANGGIGTVTDVASPYQESATVTVMSNSFMRENYTFTGWNTMADGSGTAYAPGNTFQMPAQNITLYAQWQETSGENPTPPIQPQPETISVTVKKEWKDDAAYNRPVSIEVQLYENQDPHGDVVTLTADHNWTYTWNELDKDSVWTVDELDVPSGYSKSVSKNGNTITITNTKRHNDSDNDNEGGGGGGSGFSGANTSGSTSASNAGPGETQMAVMEPMPEAVQPVPDQTEMVGEDIPAGTLPKTGEGGDASLTVMLLAIVGLAVLERRKRGNYI